MFRRAWWRAIPSELLVPIALSAMLEIVGLLLPNERFIYRSGPTLSVATELTRSILLLCGLLELRHRGAGRASWLVAAALLQGVTIALRLAITLAPVLIAPRGPPGYWEFALYAWSGVALCFTIAMITAARSWRSWAAPLAIIATLAWRVPPVIGDWVLEPLLSDLEPVVYAFAAPLLAQLALLAIARRFGAGPAPAADVARAESGARRAARWLRVRGLTTLVQAIFVIALIVLDTWAEWFAVLSLVLGVVALTAVICQMSGVLGMAGGSIAGLSPFQMRVAAFGALWEGLVATFVVHDFTRPGLSLMILVLLVAIVCLMFGASAMRTLADQCGDAALATMITNRTTVVVLLQTVMFLVLVGINRGMVTVVLMTGYALQQVAVVVVLASVYARVAQRVRMAAAVDAF